MSASSHLATPESPVAALAPAVGRRRTARVVAVIAAAGAIGAGLSACSPDEEASDAPDTTPSGGTGNQAPPGDVSGVDGHSGKATAELKDAEGKSVGTATFTSLGDAVKVAVVVSGLPAGFHGMHLHANGECKASGAEPFTSAGGHLQVDGNTGHPASGDLVSINVLEDGSGETSTTTDKVTLEQVAGTSIIIHADPDNFGNIPTRYAAEPDERTLTTGDAGSRIACGVIEAVEEHGDSHESDSHESDGHESDGDESGSHESGEHE